MCQDPHTNEGLFPLTYRGCIQGFWRGKFLFYDFEFYRHILSGNLRGVYTGVFAEQVIEAELRETLVKVKKEDVGGDGPLLTAGFKDMGSLEEETRFLEEGYGQEIVDDDDEDEEGWTKEILISGRVSLYIPISAFPPDFTVYSHTAMCSVVPLGVGLKYAVGLELGTVLSYSVYHIV